MLLCMTTANDEMKSQKRSIKKYPKLDYFAHRRLLQLTSVRLTLGLLLTAVYKSQHRDSTSTSGLSQLTIGKK